MRFRRLRVFAVEDRAAQVCWGAARPGTHTISAGPAEVKIETDGAPGAVDLNGLPPGTRLELRVEGGGAGHFETLARPPGAELFRIATVNDVHIGDKAFGFLNTMQDRWGGEFATRCLRAALDEALAWGAQLVIVKGDLTHKGRAAEFEIVADLLADLPVPVEVTLGNHDVCAGAADGRAILARRGILVPDEPWHRDVPGVRVVMADTTVRRHRHGHIPPDKRDRVAELVAGAAGGAMVAIHHYPQRFGPPVIWPPGIPGGQSRALLDAIAEANPATLLVSGHSHRHRRHHHGPLTHAEIGSTKDYPGAWAGYAVHEGGIRQVVRRVARPDAIAWTEYTRRAVLGVWGLWSPGLRSHRCFTVRWPPRP